MAHQGYCMWRVHISSADVFPGETQTKVKWFWNWSSRTTEASKNDSVTTQPCGVENVVCALIPKEGPFFLFVCSYKNYIKKRFIGRNIFLLHLPNIWSVSQAGNMAACPQGAHINEQIRVICC